MVEPRDGTGNVFSRGAGASTEKIFPVTGPRGDVLTNKILKTKYRNSILTPSPFSAYASPPESHLFAFLSSVKFSPNVVYSAPQS
jgi:hypothetical protein